MKLQTGLESHYSNKHLMSKLTKRWARISSKKYNS